MKAALLYLFAASAWAQTLTPVTAPAGSGVPFWAWPVAAVVIVIAGFVWLKFKKPAAATTVQTAVSADVAALTAAIGRLIDHTAPATPVDLSSAVTAAPAADPLQPQLDAATSKLAQIKAIVEG